MYLPHECAPGLVVQPEWRGFRPLFDREAIEKPWEIEGKRALTKSFALNSTPAKKLGQSSRKVASVVKSDVKHRLPAFTLIKNSGPDLTAKLMPHSITRLSYLKKFCCLPTTNIPLSTQFSALHLPH